MNILKLKLVMCVLVIVGWRLRLFKLEIPSAPMYCPWLVMKGVALMGEVEQEAESVVSLPSYRPTKSEYNEHCVTHSPY